MASATEARVHFGELMRQVVEENTPVIVERGGKPQVVILSIAEYERLSAERDEPEEWQRLLREAHELIIAETGGGPLVPSVDDVIRDMREERDAELLGGLH